MSNISRTRSFRVWWLVGLVALALAALLTYAQLTGGGASGQGAAAPTPSADADVSASVEHPIVRRDEGDPAAIGAVDAPVVLVYWTDMRCPFCAVFSRDTLPALLDEYVDGGKVRIEFRDVAFFGEESARASAALEAAGNQGLYVEYLEAVYAVAPESGHPELTREELIAFAEQVGVPDMAAFTTGLDSPAGLAAAAQRTQEAQQLGVTAVPFFLAGDTAMSGAQATDVFRTFLDDALAKAE
ncbi:DsbA family protein [Microbacterium oxydans]|uniref:DsbA family protein n=1 Tax=Microbacterium oxydans TaxID=82380 RepID=UPI00226B7DCD|nr:thioredoxin domain-containing protein [Microbacterium oxydans]WAA65631.1 DsbA family protein [Microbacterium oxydans]